MENIVDNIKDNNLIKNMPKRDFHFWVILSSTLILAVVSILTPQFLSKYKNRFVSPGTPGNSAAAGSLCTLTYAIPTPTPFICNKTIDILGISVDRSGSMSALESDGRSKLTWAKEATQKMVQTIQNSGTNTIRIGVNSFGAQGNFSQGATGSHNLSSPEFDSLLHTPLTNNYSSVIAAVNSIPQSVCDIDCTCIQCGIRLANQQISTSTTEKIVILLSDGMANRVWNGGTSGPKAAAINEANLGRAQGVSYYVIGYGKVGGGEQDGIDEATLKSIAGKASNYQYKPNATDWAGAMFNILQSACSTTATATPTSSAVSTPTPTKAAVSTPTPTQTASTNIVASEDSYVSVNYKSSNYGNQTQLQVDGSTSAKIAYLKFNLTSLAGKTINNASLRLRITDSSSHTQVIKSVASTTWTESTIKYNNKPALGSVITSFVGGPSGSYKSIDLTAFINANKGKVVTIAIDETQTDGLNFRSSEYSTAAYRPTLIIQ